jgi:hypothetical protein
MVAPLAALQHDGKDYWTGSGFLVQIDGQIYLVTAAHLMNGEKDQTDDWSQWVNEITLVDESLRAVSRVPVFDVDGNGTKVPRFLFGRPQDAPGRIMDIILLPLSPEEAMSSMSTIFALPSSRATYKLGDEVTMLGRRDPWPNLSVAKHVLTDQAGAVLYMHPEGQQGDSGGPVVCSTGLLVGMNYGGQNSLRPGAILISAELIEKISTAVNGFIGGWAYTYSVNALVGPR